MDTAYRFLAGIDVHKRMVAVVIRRDEGGAVSYEQRTFGTTQSEIQHLAAYLQQYRVSEAMMESTAQYWRPVWYGLEPHFKLHLCHPLKTRGRRGRKSDFRDARRLVDRLHSGDLEDSFVPGAEQRDWRWLSRTRVDLKDKEAVVRSQVEGLLEQSGIKLAAVASDPFGVSGWAMLQRLAQGETNVEALIGEARGTLRRKRAELREAFAGHLTPVYRMLLRQYLDQVSLLRKQMAEIEDALLRAMQAYGPTLQRLCRLPGVDLIAAQQMLAEIGPTAAAFATASSSFPGRGFAPARKSQPASTTAAGRRRGTASSAGCSLR